VLIGNKGSLSDSFVWREGCCGSKVNPQSGVLGRAVLIFAFALHKNFSARDLVKKKNIARISATAQFKARLHPVASLHHN
jgi:hypothetical protein